MADQNRSRFPSPGLPLKPVLGLPAVASIAIGTTVGGGVFLFTGIVLKIGLLRTV